MRMRDLQFLTGSEVYPGYISHWLLTGRLNLVGSTVRGELCKIILTFVCTWITEFVVYFYEYLFWLRPTAHKSVLAGWEVLI